MSGYSIKAEQAARARGERPCPNCSHPNYLHRELQRCTYALNADKTEITEVPNPAYRPMVFHCGDETCHCYLDATGRTTLYGFDTNELDRHETRIANRYAGRCHLCQGQVPAEQGTWDRSDGCRHAMGKCRRSRKAGA